MKFLDSLNGAVVTGAPLSCTTWVLVPAAGSTSLRSTPDHMYNVFHSSQPIAGSFPEHFKH